MAKAIFYDPQRKRWGRLRLLFDTAGVIVTLVMVFFVFTVVRSEPLKGVLLPDLKRPYKALPDKERRRARARPASHRTSKKPPSQVLLNQEEGIRGAFYVNWDAASFASLHEYVHQIDLLFPEWLHVLTPDGHMQAVTPANELFNVFQKGSGFLQKVDDRVMPFLKAENAETEVLPLVNNYDPTNGHWIDTSKFFNNSIARKNFREQLGKFLQSDKYRGVTIDFEAFPLAAQPGFNSLLSELQSDLRGRGLKLYVALPVQNNDFDYAYIASQVDGVILMNYDQHYPGGGAGAVAAQEWFAKNLQEALKVIPREKLICAIGNYGYDWVAIKGKGAGKNGRSVSVQEAWLGSQESDATIEFDPDTLNPHYAYLDEANRRHDVWYLDAVTALNQMRAASELGITTFALWRLGAEDRSLWAVWDLPGEQKASQKLGSVPPGQDVDMEGKGEVLRIEQRPRVGERDVVLDSSSGLITSEKFKSLPLPYQIAQYGAQEKKIAITFDDGPDPRFTPKILDILKAEKVKATFFLIGLQAEKFPSLTRRVYREGHEIGNHTFTHPDIGSISRRYMRVELNLAERFFAASLGIKPLFFRPPYSIDQEPDTADQVRPLEVVQDMGYTTVGDKIDPNDWRESPHRSAEEITSGKNGVMAQLDRGNIILLHDGGGDRSETVRALPMMIHELRARGYELVPVSALLGKTSAEVMPSISANERWSAQVDSFGFWLFGLLNAAIVYIFFLGDILMSGRLLIVGALAVFDRFRKHNFEVTRLGSGYQPAIAVVIPAYNEEAVIERTVRAALDSRYPKLRVIVVNDGSTDATLEVARRAFKSEVVAGRVVILSKPNSGKAEALNFGLEEVSEEIFVGIDADTVVAPAAISRLVKHFLNPRVGAVAGNAKVGNRVNLWTRWQALEYITSQNFERRALNVFGAVSVVPGAVGAWRTSAVRESGGFHVDTVAEDADLTMSLLRRGYRVEYEDSALAYTEAPMNARALMRQRFRWSFGILQSVWKHRAAFGRKGVLGWIALPNIVIFQILLPVVSPFIDVMFVIGALAYAVDRSFHPETANPASFQRLVIFFFAFLIIDFLASAIAFGLERKEARSGADLGLLAQVWLQRLAYRQLFSLVLLKTFKRALEGRRFAWDKLERTAMLRYPEVPHPVEER